MPKRKAEMKRRQVRSKHLEPFFQTFPMTYFGVVLFVLIICGLVGPSWDAKYPKILAPNLYYQDFLSQNAIPSAAYTDRRGILIAVDRKGVVFCDYKTIALDKLEEAVIHNVRYGSGIVYVKADQALPYGILMSVLKRCSMSGAKAIRILLEDRTYAFERFY